MVKSFLIGAIRFYQKRISPLKSKPSCRFYPTCSQYAIDALSEWGVVRGLCLALWRILRCNPLNPGGIDYVPVNKRRHEK